MSKKYSLAQHNDSYELELTEMLETLKSIRSLLLSLRDQKWYQLSTYNMFLIRDQHAKDAMKHFPAEGEGTLSGVIVETDTKTGLAKNVIRIINGGSLTK